MSRYRRITPSEHEEQAAFVQWVLQQFRLRDDFRRRLFFSVPNGAWTGGGYKQAAKLKREGLTSGVADMLYLQPRGPYPYLAIELKTVDRRGERRGGLSTTQEEFLEQAAGEGACVDVCYGAEEAMVVFTQYMSMEATYETKEQGITGEPGGLALLAGSDAPGNSEPEAHQEPGEGSSGSVP
jgi:hypothetical protein